jgi:hypothetical protein
MRKKSIYKKVRYDANVDCFAVGVVAWWHGGMVAWELIMAINAFGNVAQDSGSTSADLNVLYYNRNTAKLSEL